MARYKPIRQRRYEKLRVAGFLPNEAAILSRVPEKTPYLRSLKQDRKIIYNKAIKRQLTIKQYKDVITKLYKKKDWSHYATIASHKIHKINASAIYKMLREYEDRYRDEKGSQAFKSPWVKKQKDFRDFTKKFDKAFAQEQSED